METEILDGGRLVVASKYLPLLRANGLDTFAAVMEEPQGRLKRDFPGRRTSRLELAQPDGSVRGVYLKRYYPEYLSAIGRVLRRMGWPAWHDEARAEWNAVEQVAALGIPTLELIARGQDQIERGAVQASFVMTAELVGEDEGHRVLARMKGAERRRLLCRVADFTRRLHAGGVVHKDLYLCHYMTSRAQSPEASVHLIDLQRLTRPRWFRERWRVKDLAALAYSSLKAGATRSDLMAGYRAYRGGGPLDAVGRKLARRILRRVAWLTTRTPRHDADFEQLSSR